MLRQCGPRAIGQAAVQSCGRHASFYPRFHDFQAIRRQMDPAGRFLNDHLRNLFA
ncbi:D-arabinono-1,4-lactone oxidase [Roseiarcus sp.]|uniref:D-arabinono-1,4-lactone oxidase n=1 Tax=Roseiarcus sp. TaxID=1969460 RepID=UPI003D11C46A